VADALAERDHLAERMTAQQALVAATQRAYPGRRALSQRRGRLSAGAGRAARAAARRDLIGLQAEEAGNRVTLYEVLGGGADAQPAAANGAGAGH
jgi:multidrug efflux system outer membrane protein